jgi:hypothetical protein
MQQQFFRSTATTLEGRSIARADRRLVSTGSLFEAGMVVRSLVDLFDRDCRAIAFDATSRDWFERSVHPGRITSEDRIGFRNGFVTVGAGEFDLD